MANNFSSVTPAIIIQIAFLNRSYTTADPTFDMWELTIIMAVITCLSILAICVPNLKPFLDSLESGQIRVDDLRRQGKSSSGGYPSYHRNGSGPDSQRSRSRAPGVSQQSGRDPLASKVSQRSKMFEMVDMHKASKKDRSQPEAQGSIGGGGGDAVAWDGQSHTSQTILIQQTKTWHVDVEDGSSSELK